MFGAVSFAALLLLGASARDFEERMLHDHATAVASISL